MYLLNFCENETENNLFRKYFEQQQFSSEQNNTLSVSSPIPSLFEKVNLKGASMPDFRRDG